MSEFEKTWNESFSNYAIDIAKIYSRNPAEILNCLMFDSVTGCLNETYRMLVKNRDLKKIEELPQADKLELWNKSKEYAEGRVKREMICRSIYLLNELTKQGEL